MNSFENIYYDNSCDLFEEFVFSIIPKIIKKGLEKKQQNCYFGLSFNSEDEMGIPCYWIADNKTTTYHSFIFPKEVLKKDILDFITKIEGTTLLPLDNGNNMFCIKLIDLMNYYYGQIEKEEKERKLVI